MTPVALPESDEHQYILTLSCQDTTGIVARISAFIEEMGGWIVEADYFTDAQSGWFFTRQAVRASSISVSFAEFKARFEEVADSIAANVQWRLYDNSLRKKAVILVSKEGHCLHDLLGRVAQNDYPMDVVAVIGNHENLRPIAEAHGIEYHYVPFPKDAVGKRKSFDEVAELVNAHEPDAIVLARFMQILPADLCEMWAGRAINIHHSFLPSFMGARPYHQAYQRGVKLIGATCHYATSDLDDGPIIEQDVIRISHKDTPADMQRKGRDAEQQVLARGLRFHLEDRVLIHGNHTVVLV
ncbi:Formyltetrahydrofolate deformylase [Corynebacterium kalinowskii]|uniref:Formyltetrahydrofolate deformylase n=1 Tax=Corynebacterium kalinowskii TaxID=2675216 RepID=A0A6B8VNI2_9CORY|nr:formyltetrahydrofolate deformylase [Corynebacterium kalinowskii]QGU02974.1 Formyltetrahydrofolate deformylase [Corynebacterium kalinowskii]